MSLFRTEPIADVKLLKKNNISIEILTQAEITVSQIIR